MVAISLYKGNLHKVATDVPRRWLIPTPKISLKDFRLLLRRRAKALSRLQSTSEVATTAVPATSNPNPNPNPIAADNPFSKVEPQIVPLPVEPPKDEKVKEEEVEVEGDKATVAKAADGVEVPEKLVEGSDVVLETKLDVLKVEKSETPVNPSGETSNKEDAPSEKEKRKKEVEEKLEVLNAKKHNLVQLLKQILSAEEELKGRNSMQGTEVEGGEGDDVSNQNVHSRNLLRMNSTSPSPDSQHRKPVHNTVPFSSRTTMGVTGSPSRFACTVQQGLPSNPPAVSTSGTNYVASTPSPAASGGTPAFRDAQLPSPWN
nr:Sal-like protein [Ipomoea batatas]